jgi:Bacterial PH domain
MDQYGSSPLERELSSGEKMLWSGQPQRGIRLRKQDAFMIPFSLVWGGFAIFWEATVIRSNGPAVMKIWGIPFVIAGLYLIFGRFFADAKIREKTFYGVTNERVLIVSGLFSRNLRSLNLKALPEICFNERADGTGTIVFGSASVYPGAQFTGSGWPGTGRFAPPSFDMIAQAREVYEIVRRTQSDAIK